MLAFKPRTTKLGMPPLPHITFLLRKPKPLGTELKNVACSKTGIILFLEIQRGKEGMRQAKYSREHGGTTACTMRLVEGSCFIQETANSDESVQERT